MISSLFLPEVWIRSVFWSMVLTALIHELLASSSCDQSIPAQ
ncbi:hypothetical protein GcM3_c18817o5 [Golovinomyces cichoracearum]|uniref:Uncharacterized protein n=1 Tax=Golovinomyces cichoracearum TaxID=62708 RepID=A0A420ITU3_9PEZI|nr:hypothetical protein GcM3_c18817o5 [Golovinomyces cichoracearum]